MQTSGTPSTWRSLKAYGRGGTWEAHSSTAGTRLAQALFVSLWWHFFKWPLSTLPDNVWEAEGAVRQWYFDEKNVPWNGVYLFIEFVGDLAGNLRDDADRFRILCNISLEREFSAYRFVGKIVAPITNGSEIKAIEEAASMDAILASGEHSI